MNIETINTTNTIKNSAFSSKEEYLSFIATWKDLSKSKKATVEHHVIYTLLLGKSIEKAFTPITNENKITSNSCDPHCALRNALRNILTLNVEIFTPWESIISQQNVKKNKRYSFEIYDEVHSSDNIVATILSRAKDILGKLN